LFVNLSGEPLVYGGVCMNFDPKKTIFLVDGSSFLYRAYYSLRPLHTPKGVAVQAVYGFCRMLKKLIDTVNPEYIAIVWDSKGKTKRHEIYPAYKATRQAPPSDLFDQKTLISQFAQKVGLAQVIREGVEADDLMFSITKERTKTGEMVVLVTADKDMGQALDENTVIFDTFKEHFVDVAKFQEIWGFPVGKLPFYFALLGDASDNIPGVHGIGKKGALDLVLQFDSLEDLYANLDKVKSPRTRTALEEQKKNAFLSMQLFLLRYEETGLHKKDFAFDPRQWAQARPLFQEWNFKSLLQELEKAPGAFEEKLKRWQQYNFKAVTNEEQLQELVAELKKKKLFALDTETTGLNALQDELVGISLCMHKGTAYYIPCVSGQDSKNNTQKATEAGQETLFAPESSTGILTKDRILHELKPVLEDSQYKKIMHNAKFDQLVLWNHGIAVQGLVSDTLIAGRLTVQEGQQSSLKSLSIFYFDESMITYEEIVKDQKRTNFSQVPLAVATLYSAADAHQTYRLYEILDQELANKKMHTLYETIELPLVQVLIDMEATGIYCDSAVLNALDKKISARLKEIEIELIDIIGKQYVGINLNSTKQVGKLLFEDLHLPPQKKSAKGTSYSTDQEVLEALAVVHPVPGLILKYRELYKLKSTYVDALPTYINPKTGRIHTSYSQTGVATGRLASSEPNLQNIPATGEGIEIRAAFKPKEGYVFLSADYSQIELRVLAHLCQDKQLMQAFLQGHDVHAQTAAGLFDVSLESVTHEQRQIGKRINFSILYGLTPYGLSQDLKISFKEAKEYIDKYFAQYPQVSSWMEHIIEQTKKWGYAKTLWGRRRYIPTIYEKNQALYHEATRVAVNTVAQGTAAELMKLGMITLSDTLKKEGYGAWILLQIHDELLLEVPEKHVASVEKLTKKVLEGVVDWTVPLVVTTRFGHDWKEVSK
jgi:DNA polymerase-1